MLPTIAGMFLWLSTTKSMTFGRSKTVSNIFIWCPIASNEINSLCHFFDFVGNLWNQTQTQKVLTSSEGIGDRMRMFDTVLERLKVIRLVSESHRNMVDSAFESWWSILSDPKKVFVIRTHPEELHVLKCITDTHISTNFSQQWAQQMLPKCYPTS